MTPLHTLPLPPRPFLAKLRGMGPLRLLFLWALSQTVRALSCLVFKVLSGSLGRWARVSHIASLLSVEAVRFEMWRRGSGFPRPGFARALPTGDKLGRIVLIAMGQSQSSLSDLECRIDWLLLLSAEADRLARLDLETLPAIARLSFDQMPMLARHGFPGRFFEDELDARAPLWRSAPAPHIARSVLKLRGSPLFAPGLNQRRARMPTPLDTPLHEELLLAEAEALNVIARARASSLPPTPPLPPGSPPP